MLLPLFKHFYTPQYFIHISSYVAVGVTPGALKMRETPYPCLNIFTLHSIFIHISNYVAVGVTPGALKIRESFLLFHSFYCLLTSNLRSSTSVLLLMLLHCGMSSEMMCAPPTHHL